MLLKTSLLITLTLVLTATLKFYMLFKNKSYRCTFLLVYII